MAGSIKSPAELSSRLPEVVRALLTPHPYPHETSGIKLVQTQMSFVFLTGKYVYKIKKPVNLGYLDYTTLEKRRYFCEQEIKLNRRLCADSYLEVVPVTRDKSGITLGGSGETIEYAVKMLYLPHERLMNVMLERNRVTQEMVERIAWKLADFHSLADTGPVISAMGKIEALRLNTEENFTQTEQYLGKAITLEQFRRIKNFTEKTLSLQADLFNRRVASGRIRDCHGDLYAANICLRNGICIYDCIEFNDRFRYCDVASEIAFLAMDLDHYGRADLSRAFVREYIKLSGDEEIPGLLKFYKCYRAYVRGKVAGFKSEDPYIEEDERKQSLEEARSYFTLSDSYTRTKPILLITAGLVGTGKSTLAGILARHLGLTVFSSDIIRKQLASIPVTEPVFEKPGEGIYSAEFSRRTYDRLYAEARSVLKQGDPVILDASFIKMNERIKARELAEETGADFIVLECTLDENTLRRRLDRRVRQGSVSDGRWEILGPQRKAFEPITEVPPEKHLVVHTGTPLEKQIGGIISRITGALEE